MLYLSEILIQDHELASFAELIREIEARALGGELFFEIDVKPPFADTPEDWEPRLERAFTDAGK